MREKEFGSELVREDSVILPNKGTKRRKRRFICELRGVCSHAVSVFGAKFEEAS